MRRGASPPLSSGGETAFVPYHQTLWVHEALADSSRRAHLRGFRQYAIWCEARCTRRADEISLPQTVFVPQAITIGALICSCASLPNGLFQKPNAVKSALIGLRRSWSRAIPRQPICNSPAPVKLVGEEVSAPVKFRGADRAFRVAVWHGNVPLHALPMRMEAETMFTLGAHCSPGNRPVGASALIAETVPLHQCTQHAEPWPVKYHMALSSSIKARFDSMDIVVWSTSEVSAWPRPWDNNLLSRFKRLPQEQILATFHLW
jgi:hypothetical protein